MLGYMNMIDEQKQQHVNNKKTTTTMKKKKKKEFSYVLVSFEKYLCHKLNGGCSNDNDGG